MNLGTEEDKKEVNIGANLEDSVKNRSIQMLRDCNTVGELTLLVLHFITNVAVSKSRHRLFDYPTKERLKRIGKTFLKILS